MLTAEEMVILTLLMATDVQFVGLICSMYQEPMTVSHRQRWNDILHDGTKGRVPPSGPWAYSS